MAGSRILYIDDSAAVRKLVESTLLRAGYVVLMASNIQEGIALGREQSPDLILLDELHVAQGVVGLIAPFRKDPKLYRVPIVILANREERFWEQIRQAEGITDLIAKPFDPELLAAAVEGVLQRSDAQLTEYLPMPDDLGEDLIDIEEVDNEWDSAELALCSLVGQIAAQPLAPWLNIDVHSLASQIAQGISAPTIAQQFASLIWTHPSLANAASLDLAGDISVFAVIDLIRLLGQREESGLLRIAESSRYVDIAFRKGRIDFVTAIGLPEDFHLGRFLVAGGMLAEETLGLVLQQKAFSPLPLGRLLLQSGYLQPEQLREGLRRQAREILFFLMRWTRGRFFFDRKQSSNEWVREAMLGVDIEPLLLEGARRVSEWYLIERRVPHFELIFTRNEEQFSEPTLAKLSREEAQILELVNGKNNVHEIIKRSMRPSYEVARTLYTLIEARLIRNKIAPVVVFG